MDEKPIRIKDAAVAPLEVVISCYPKPLGMAELQGRTKDEMVTGSVGCSAVEVWGKKDGKNVSYIYIYFVHWLGILKVYRDMPHAAHISHMAGTRAAILTRQLSKREIETKGLLTPEDLERKHAKHF